jgi:phospholipid/cholesterol/gamma-HCH transport system ATP-binding protein
MPAMSEPTPPPAVPPAPVAADAPLIALEGVGVTFHANPVLRGISLHIPRGQTLVVIGESGCGKTVLLKLLIGLLRASAGHVLFDGRELAQLNDRELTQQRLRFGFLFQGAALFDSLSVYDNVAFGLREQRRLNEAQIRDVVRQRLQEVGLPANVEPRKPAELSGGMRKRVGLARALAIDPEVMLYDEPTTGLDPIMGAVIDGLIVDCVKRLGSTAVAITHDMASARRIGDTAAMIHRGKIVWSGPAAALMDSGNPEVDQFTHGRREGPIQMELRR